MGSLKFNGEESDLPNIGYGCYASYSTVVCVNVASSGLVEAVGAAYRHQATGQWLAAVLGAPRLLQTLEVTDEEVRAWAMQERQSQVRFQDKGMAISFFMKQTFYKPGVLHSVIPDENKITVQHKPMWDI